MTLSSSLSREKYRARPANPNGGGGVKLTIEAGSSLLHGRILGACGGVSRPQVFPPTLFLHGSEVELVEGGGFLHLMTLEGRAFVAGWLWLQVRCSLMGLLGFKPGLGGYGSARIRRDPVSKIDVGGMQVGISDQLHDLSHGLAVVLIPTSVSVVDGADPSIFDEGLSLCLFGLDASAGLVTADGVAAVDGRLPPKLAGLGLDLVSSGPARVSFVGLGFEFCWAFSLLWAWLDWVFITKSKKQVVEEKAPSLPGRT